VPDGSAHQPASLRRYVGTPGNGGNTGANVKHLHLAAHRDNTRLNRERSFDCVTRAILWRTAPLLAVAGATAMIAISSAPNAMADSSNRVAVCSSEVVSGVEVDNCVPNPNANITRNVPGVDVELEGGVGVGLG
jgi:hypothetical protein